MMDEKMNEKIQVIREEIQNLNTKIHEKEAEIQNIYASANAVFEGSYVKYYNGEGCFWFMKVERQTFDSGYSLTLHGPCIALDGNPLAAKDYEESEEIQSGEFEESATLTIHPNELAGYTTSSIARISKEDFSYVLTEWIKTVKKKFRDN